MLPFSLLHPMGGDKKPGVMSLMIISSQRFVLTYARTAQVYLVVLIPGKHKRVKYFFPSIVQPNITAYSM